MASPMQGQLIEWGKNPPCNIPNDDQILYGEPVDWKDHPEPPLTITIGECLYLIEYYTSNSQYHAGIPISIGSVLKIPLGTNCPPISKQELWQQAMIAVLDKIQPYFPGYGTQGNVYQFYNAACASFVDWDNWMDNANENDFFLESPIIKGVKFNVSIEELFDNPTTEAEISAINSLRGLAIGDPTSNEWGLPVVGGLIPCESNSACCRAQYWVKVDKSDHKPIGIKRIGDIVYNNPLDCSTGYTIMPFPSSCEPNCDVFFDEWGLLDNFYPMIISPNPAQNMIHLSFEGLPSGYYQVMIIKNNQDIEYNKIIPIDNWGTDIDISFLENGQYSIVILFNGEVVSSSIFIVYR